MSPTPAILLTAAADSDHHLNVLLLLGVAVFGGTIGTRIFRRLRIPQIIGSILVGLLIGESGLHLVSEAVVMDRKIPIIHGETPLKEVIRTVSGTESFYDPVVDGENRLAGAITLHGIRNTFATQELNDWLVALDIMEPVVARVTPEMPLAEAFSMARQYNLDCLPVVRAEGQDALIGVLDCPATRRSLSSEVLSRQGKADNIHGIQCA